MIAFIFMNFSFEMYHFSHKNPSATAYPLPVKVVNLYNSYRAVIGWLHFALNLLNCYWSMNERIQLLLTDAVYNIGNRTLVLSDWNYAKIFCFTSSKLKMSEVKRYIQKCKTHHWSKFNSVLIKVQQLNLFFVCWGLN